LGTLIYWKKRWKVKRWQNIFIESPPPDFMREEIDFWD